MCSSNSRRTPWSPTQRLARRAGRRSSLEDRSGLQGGVVDGRAAGAIGFDGLAKELEGGLLVRIARLAQLSQEQTRAPTRLARVRITGTIGPGLRALRALLASGGGFEGNAAGELSRCLARRRTVCHALRANPAIDHEGNDREGDGSSTGQNQRLTGRRGFLDHKTEHQPGDGR